MNPTQRHQLPDNFFNELSRIASDPAFDPNSLPSGVSYERSIFFFKDNVIDRMPACNNQALDFTNCQFKQTVIFDTEISPAFFGFRSCEFDRGIHFLNGTFERPIDIHGRVKKTVLFSGGKYRHVRISGESIREVAIKGGEVGNLEIRGEPSDKLKLDQFSFDATNFKGEIYLVHLLINFISLRGISRKDSLLFFKIIEARSLIVQDFINEGHIRFFNLLPDSGGEKNLEPIGKICIDQSHLGNTQFTQIDFRKFNLSISESFLSDAAFVNVHWPKHINAYFSTDPPSGADADKELPSVADANKISRENYRQLKLAYSKQGDFVNEAHFHSLEMKSYLKTLYLRKDFATWFVLKLSAVTSNFGLSLWRPLATMILANGVLIWILYKNGGDPTESKGGLIPNILDALFRMNNPLRKFDPHLYGWNLVIDTLIRIIASYSIYNFIRATRRFVK